MYSPLSDILVVERSRTLAGAYAGTIFAELGASVQRVAYDDDTVNRYFRSVTDSKKSVLDGRVWSARQFQGANVVIDDGGDGPRDGGPAPEGPGPVMLRLELVEPEHAGLGSGWTSDAVCAVSGVSIAVGDASREPLGLPEDLTAQITAVNGVGAVLSALLLPPSARPRQVRVSTAALLEYFVGMNGKMYEGYTRRWMREGSRAAGSSGPYPAAIFPCADGHVVMLARSREDWHAILEALGDPAWAERDGYRDPWWVADHGADEVDGYLEDWLATKTRDEVLDLGQKFGFPAAPIRSVSEALDEDQLGHRRFLRHQKLASKTVCVPGLPLRVQARSETGTANPQGRAGRDVGLDSAPLLGLPSAYLAGLRVLDLSWVWSGPMVAMTLGDLGADVIKVEHSRRPDSSRLRGRPSRDGRPVEGPATEVTPYFHQMNHAKRSIELDITDLADAHALRHLAETADVIVENMRPGVLDKYQLGYASLAESNPGLIMVSMSLAGAEGPLKDAKGYAAVMSAMSGLESLVGYDDELTGLLSFAVGDPNAASHGLVAVLAALHERQRVGTGCWIDLSQLEALIFGLTGEAIAAQVGPIGYQHAAVNSWRSEPSGTFRCAGGDDWTVVEFHTDDDWAQFCVMAEIAHLPRFATDARRALGGWCGNHRREEVLSVLGRCGATVAPIRTIEEVRASAGGRTLQIEHPYGGVEQIWVPPWWFDGRLPGSPKRAPVLGEHNNEILDTEFMRLPASNP